MVGHLRILGRIETIGADPYIVEATDGELGPAFGVGPGSVVSRQPIPCKKKAQHLYPVSSSKIATL